MKKLTIGLSALALGIGGVAYAAHHGPDGPMSRADAETRANAMFAKMDANNDGVLTEADREARKAARKSEMFAKIDADSNGQISRDEFMAFEHKGMRAGHKGHGKGHHRMGKGHGGMMMHKMADADGDGSISKAEFTAAALKRFDKADANNDGTVTPEERQAMHAQMREKMQAMKQKASN